MRSFLGNLTANSEGVIKLTPHYVGAPICGKEPRVIGPTLDNQTRDTWATDYQCVISNSGRLFWMPGNDRAAARQWIIPEDAELGGGDDTNVSVYATEDQRCVMIDLERFDSRFIGIRTTKKIFIIDLQEDDCRPFPTVKEYDRFLTKYLNSEEVNNLPVPIWDGENLRYEFEDDAWVKPTIKRPKPEG